DSNYGLNSSHTTLNQLEFIPEKVALMIPIQPTPNIANFSSVQSTHGHKLYGLALSPASAPCPTIGQVQLHPDQDQFME
ncbi:Hypothetical predicted protein, partial [Olea europaea subsp. europaea]